MDAFAPEQLGTVLGVWAHPDDEAYLSAALMAAAVDAGQRVVCVTATRGEAGSLDHDRWPPEKMAEVREAELLRCLEHLGVSDHRWLDHRDGTCHEVPHERGVAQVREIIEEVRPDSVLTFGPEGMTGHLDHIAISNWTTEAFEQAAPDGARLFHATVIPEWAEVYVPMLQRFDVYLPGTPVPTPREECSIVFEPRDGLLDKKVRAILEHRSQVEGIYEAFGQDQWREALRGEYFRLAQNP